MAKAKGNLANFGGKQAAPFGKKTGVKQTPTKTTVKAAKKTVKKVAKK